MNCSEFIFAKISLILYLLATENYGTGYIVILIYGNTQLASCRYKIRLKFFNCLKISSSVREIRHFLFNQN